MKRNTLTPGQDYWYDTSTNWEAYPSFARMRVLTMQELVEANGYNSGTRKADPVLVTIYNNDVLEVPRVFAARLGVDRVDSVLCQRLNADGTPFVRRYYTEPKAPEMVRAAYLRGPYVALNERFTEEARERTEREAKRKAELDAVEAQGRALIARAAALGVDIHHQNRHELREGYVDLSLEEFDALILRAEGADL